MSEMLPHSCRKFMLKIYNVTSEYENPFVTFCHYWQILTHETIFVPNSTKEDAMG